MDGEIGQEGEGGEDGCGMHFFGSGVVGGLEELEVDIEMCEDGEGSVGPDVAVGWLSGYALLHI